MLSHRGGLSGRIGFAGIALVPIACCALLSLLAAGATVAVVIAASGVGVAVVAVLGTSYLITRRNLKEAGVTHDCCTNATREVALGGGDLAHPLVEILYFDGCPNHEGARALVERVSRELGVDPEMRLVNVPDQEAAQRLRFLGSPTIRVAGEDVDPHAGERDDYVLSCRVYRTDSGFAGQPDERWVRHALRPHAPNSKTTASNPA